MPRFRAKNDFSGGEIDIKLKGRFDADKWAQSVEEMQDFIPLPTGPAATRPGKQYTAEVEDSTKTTRLVPFIVAIDVAYVLEFGDAIMRVYRDDGTGPGRVGTVELATPYAAADVMGLQFTQSVDVMWITHPDHPVYTVTRVADQEWIFDRFRMLVPPTAERIRRPNDTLSINTTVQEKLATTTINIFYPHNVGNVLRFNGGYGIITHFLTSKAVLFQIYAGIDTYDGGTYNFTNNSATPLYEWSIDGSPNVTVEFEAGSDTSVGGSATLSLKTGQEQFARMLDAGAAFWTASGSGTNEFYTPNTTAAWTVGTASGTSAPDNMYEELMELTPGTLGSLQPGEWAFGDNDFLGYNTIYVRLRNSQDPDVAYPFATRPYGLIAGRKDLAVGDERTFLDIREYIYINGGCLEVMDTSDLLVGSSAAANSRAQCRVVSELDNTNDATPGAWTVQWPIWDQGTGNGYHIGYPSAVAFQDNRLIFGGTTAFPLSIWCSRTDDYGSFYRGDATTLQADFGITIGLATRQLNELQWIEGYEDLFIGTDAAEWKIDYTNGLDATEIGKRRDVTRYGSHSLQPVRIDSLLIFMQRHQQRMRVMSFDRNVNAYKAGDLTLFHDTILTGGIDQMAFAQLPYPIVYAVRADGTLLGLLYERDVTNGWFRITDDYGTYESVAVVPHPSNKFDQVWVVVNRTIDGSTVRYIEVFDDISERVVDIAALSDNRQLDSYLTYSGASTGTLTGLDHLEGEAVTVLTGGKVQAEASAGDHTVTGGQITVSPNVTEAVVGLPFSPIMKNLPLRADVGGFGQAQEMQKTKMVFRVNKSLYLQTGPASDKLDDIDNKYDFGFAVSFAADELFTGDVRGQFPGGIDDDTTIYIKQANPYPLTVLAMMPEIQSTGGSAGEND